MQLGRKYISHRHIYIYISISIVILRGKISHRICQRALIRRDNVGDQGQNQDSNLPLANPKYIYEPIFFL